MHEDNLPKPGNILVAVLILKKEDIFGILCFIVNGSVEKGCAVGGEGAVTGRTCRKWCVQSCAGGSHWTVLHSQVDELKLITIQSRH